MKLPSLVDALDFREKINGRSTLLASQLRRACCQAPDFISKNSHFEVVST